MAHGHSPDTNTGSMSHHPSNPGEVKKGIRKAQENWKPELVLGVSAEEWDKPQKNQQRMQRTRPGGKKELPQTQRNQRETSIKVLKSYTLMVEVHSPDSRGSSTR